MSIEKLRQSLKWAFGDVNVEMNDDGRFVAEADGYIKAGNDNVPLVAFGETEEQALETLAEMVQANAVKQRVKYYPPQIADPSRVFADDEHRVLFRHDQFIVR